MVQTEQVKEQSAVKVFWRQELTLERLEIAQLPEKPCSCCSTQYFAAPISNGACLTMSKPHCNQDNKQTKAEHTKPLLPIEMEIQKKKSIKHASNA